MKTRRLAGRRRQRGWVMIAVLMILLLLTLLTTGFYMQAEDATSLTRTTQAQQVAIAHAEHGLQEAIRMIRAAQVSTGSILGQCTDAEVAANTCPAGNFISSALVDNGGTADLASGGGLQYQFVIYKRPSGDPGQPVNRVVVRSTGYHGYRLTAANLVTSIVEVEMDVGKGNKFECVGSYECN